MSNLYSFWRSSASYRVRIVLNLKGLPHDILPVHFRKEGGQHRKPEFLVKNPQGLLPLWEEDGWCLSQSMAIMEYLDELHPEPKLLPLDIKMRAEVRAMSQIIACEIHPLNNLRVMGYLRNTMGQSEDDIKEWYREWVTLGFEALEVLLVKTAGMYCFRDNISLVDCCLIPQVYNARRFNCDLSAYPIIERIDRTFSNIEAFQLAAPESQVDAE